MKIAVTGSTGLVGSALVPILTGAGNEVICVRRPADWNPSNGTIQAGALAGVAAVVHLAGENIAGGRWSPARKARIRDSRVNGTKLIADTIAKMDNPPEVLLSASAIGYYGDRGSEVMREDSPAGKGFLADVCRQWESATDSATRRGIRVVHLRLGMVLSGRGGALRQMLFPFKAGVGGRIGSGKQYWSWVSLDDVCSAIVHCMQAGGLHGPVNIVAPAAVTNAQFTDVLASALHRPAFFTVPAFAARLVFGEMADALLLASARVEPHKLTTSRFMFRHRTLEAALSGSL